MAGFPLQFRTGQSVQLRTLKRHTTKRVPPWALPTLFQFIHHPRPTRETFAPPRTGRPRLPPTRLPTDTFHHHHQLSGVIRHLAALLHRIVTRRRPCTTLQHPSQPPPVPSHRHPVPVLNIAIPSRFLDLQVLVDPRTAPMLRMQPVASHQLALLAYVGRR